MLLQGSVLTSKLEFGAVLCFDELVGIDEEAFERENELADLLTTAPGSRRPYWLAAAAGWRGAFGFDFFVARAGRISTL